MAIKEVFSLRVRPTKKYLSDTTLKQVGLVCDRGLGFICSNDDTIAEDRYPPPSVRHVTERLSCNDIYACKVRQCMRYIFRVLVYLR